MKEVLESTADSSGIVTDSDGNQPQVGFFLVPWKCDAENELKVREETKATLRCYPLDCQDEVAGQNCFYSGEPATHMAIFARAY